MSSTPSTSSPSKSSTTASTTTSSHPLTDISPNTTSPLKPSDNPFKILQPENKTDEMPTTCSEQAATYISPSDAMLSPTTKKLSEIKGRRFASAKTSQLGSRALFQKAVMGGKGDGSKISGD